MQVRDFQKYAVGAVAIYDFTMSLAYFGSSESIPIEYLDCRINRIQLGLCLSCSAEDYDDAIPFPYFIIQLES